MLVAPGGDNSSAHATISVNDLASVDLLQAAFSGLNPGQNYVLWLVDARTAPFGHKEALVTFKANLAGAQIAQAIGPLRRVLAPNTPEHAQPRFLLLTQTDSDVPVLIQKDM
jgi:hypothetical protein